MILQNTTHFDKKERRKEDMIDNQYKNSIIVLQITIIILSAAILVNTFKISQLKEKTNSLNDSCNECSNSNYSSNNTEN